MDSADDVLARQLLADLAGLAATPLPSISARRGAGTTDAGPRRPLKTMTDELAAADPDRMPWAESWFDQTDPGEIAACRKLWCSVLLSCIRAALGLEVGVDQRNCKAIPLSWIGSKDFHIVCALAGFDGTAIADRLGRDDLVDGIRARFAGEPKGGAAQKIRLGAQT